MFPLFRHARWLFLAIPLIPAAPAFATATLLLTDNDSTPGSTTVNKGGSFPVSVKLTSSPTVTPPAPAPQVTALDYFVQATLAGNPASGVFTLTSRNTQTVGSSFPDPYATDATVSGQTLTGANARNSSNLGGSEADVTKPVSNGTFEVADLVLSVASSAAPGVYTLSTFSNPLTGYTDANFNDHAFDSQGSFTVTVLPTPEPTGLALLGVGVMALGARRRRGAIQPAARK